ncbi:hypothetical protein OAV36_00955 [Flavobacteriales bacterium]|nr:hypothetical protein [Flavobacteriales bacterium]
MLSKILKIATPIILIFIILFIGYNSYKQVTENTENPLNIIPTNAAIILQCNDADALYNTLNTTDIWGHLRNISTLDSINNYIKGISSFYAQHPLIFKTHTLFVSFHKVGANNSGLLFSSNFERKAALNNAQVYNLLGNLISEGQYNNQAIFKIVHKGRTLFLSFKGDIVFFSENKMLVEDAIRASVAEDKLTTNPSFSIAYNTISKSADINLFYNYNSLFEYSNVFSSKAITTSDFSGWVATDLSIKNKLIIANGFSAFNKSTTNFTDVLSNQSAEPIGITTIIPENTSLLFSIGFNNAKQLFEKKNKILQQQNNFWSWDKHRKLVQDSSNVNYNEFINELEGEAGIFNTSATQSSLQKYAFFKSKNSITASSLMQGLVADNKEYENYSINSINDANITAQLFGDLFNNNTPYFTIIDDYFIFGSTIASLEYLIDNYISDNTLANSQNFSNYDSYLSAKSNLLFYINPGKIANALKDKLQASYSKNLNFNTDSLAKFTAFSLQMTSKKDLILNNINLFYDADFKESIKEEWFVQLDTSVSMNPQFVYNHFTKEKMIIVQNDDYKVFAINSKGEELWSLQLNSRILGKISSIDAYKNNKYQCLFNTENQLYLIDRNGKHVDDFPQLLPSNTTIGHALFDYNNTKKYRILIIGEDNNIYNLDKKGKKVKGWKYEKNSNRIQQTPNYYRIGTKDYIIAERNNSSTQLLAINGSERVKFEEGIQFNNNPIQKDKNGTLYAITTEGRLWRGTLDANSSTTILPELNSSSKLLCAKIVKDKVLSEPNSYNLIYSNNSQLYIIDVLDFKSIYSFTLDSEITSIKKAGEFLGVTTKNKLYLYNTYGLVDGFPIDSDGFFNIDDIDNNNKVNLINSKNGFIYNYELGSFN